MITLHGFALSNYHNKVKLALLEKGLPFEEKVVDLKAKDEAMLQASPLEYLEDLQPEPPLLPKDPFAAAKVRELVTFLDWHLEIAARQLYGAAFFGAPPLSESNAARIRREVEQKIAGFRQLAKFSPYVAGDSFTMADCSAFANLPLVGMATKAIYGEDLLAAAGVDYKPYLKFIGERPSAQRVVADRKASQARA
jgi:glutathione S-transferase